MKLHIGITATLFALALPFTAAAQHHHGMHTDQAPTSKAAQNPIFVAYEEGRQALIEESLPQVRDAADDLAQAARAARESKLAKLAAKLAGAADMSEAREAFAAVSDEAIRYRSSANGARPTVIWCEMEKKSWMQPGGKIGNPYVDESMRTCGEIVPEDGITSAESEVSTVVEGGSQSEGPLAHMLGRRHWVWIVVMLPLMLVMML
jgi:hypothetical protein